MTSVGYGNAVTESSARGLRFSATLDHCAENKHYVVDARGIGAPREGAVGDERDYDEAWELERRKMSEGLGLQIGPITWSRDELHER